VREAYKRVERVARKTNILDTNDIQSRQSAQETAQDVVVEVFVSRQPDHGATPLPWHRP
jgi:hypothetical protein